MSESNGHGREGKPPFGPHGEDCTCDLPEDEEQEEQQPEEESTQQANHQPTIQMDYDSSDRHELMFAAVSDSLVRHFLIANETLMMEGDKLSRSQLQRLLSMLMRAFATAKESAWIVEQEYARLMAEAAAAESNEEDPSPLADLKEAFSRGSQS